MKTYSESDIKAAITDLLSENETQYGSRTSPPTRKGKTTPAKTRAPRAIPANAAGQAFLPAGYFE